MKKIYVIFCVTLLSGCATTPAPDKTTVKPEPQVAKCEMVSEYLSLANQSVRLPAKGRFVLESHLVTWEDQMSRFPKSQQENIEGHLDLSCEILKTRFGVADCKQVYTSSYHKEWTPAEPTIGKGSVGDAQLKTLALSMEMWSGNMFWTAASKPKQGTLFLACFESNCVVVPVGYETGPGDKQLLGGFQGEVFHFLKAKPASNKNGVLYGDYITWGRLKDQTLSPGPITCTAGT